ncbi:hypothetical protein DFQ26_005362 [Actinomortierella ambigua]|nr:hypothetical protein DFQ26_005362 [Actinomortierella ambigua]
MTEARRKALESFLASPTAQGYGYNGRIDTIRQEQYPQIKDAVYLDHAGATLPAQAVLQRFTADLTQHLYANPHSKSPSSQATSARINAVRRQILEHFGASTRGEWDVIFTANATAAIKLVGEAFPWTMADEVSRRQPQQQQQLQEEGQRQKPHRKAASRLMLLREAHTSLVGLRALADDPSKAIQVETLDRATIEARLGQQQSYQSSSVSTSENDNDEEEDGSNKNKNSNNDDDDTMTTIPSTSYNLFAYPAQCNFSGRRFPLSWSKVIREQFSSRTSKTLVLLDAASYVMTSALSLSDLDTAPDFMVVSFYKMFGFPTGLGCLIVKTEHRDLLLKQRYFGGGSVSAIASTADWQVYRDELHGRFEDGTLNFLDIVGLEHAFATAKSLYGEDDDDDSSKDYRERVSAHVTALHRLLYDGLRQLRHWNGAPVCALYIEQGDQDRVDGPSSLVGDPTQYGPIINFNVKQSNGKWIGYGQVEQLASMKGIHVRTGGFCNPGSMQRWLDLSADQLMKNLEAGHVCWDDTDILDDKPTGSIRVSLGAMSTAQDVLYLLDFMSEYFVETSDPTAVIDLLGSGVGSEHCHPQKDDEATIEVDSLVIYPIKSCRGYKIPLNKPWPIERHGLRYDREWMLVDAATGAAMTQKRFPRMCLIRTEVLLDRHIMIIEIDDGLGHDQDKAKSDGRLRGTTALSTPPPSPRRPSSPALQDGGGDGDGGGPDSVLMQESSSCAPQSKEDGHERQLIISLEALEATQPFQASSSRVCGDCTKVISYEDPQIHAWFSKFLGHDCRLVRQPSPATTDKDDGGMEGNSGSGSARLPVSTRHVKAHLNAPQGAPITLTNESPFLLIAHKSVERVQAWIDERSRGEANGRHQALTSSRQEGEVEQQQQQQQDEGDNDEEALRRRRHEFTSDSFRANFVTRGQGVGFEEDRWSRIQIGRQVFDILGPCRRCHMVTIDQKRATKNNDVFLALSKHRKAAGGQIFFGMHMLHRADLSVAPYQVQVGDRIRTLNHSSA